MLLLPDRFIIHLRLNHYSKKVKIEPPTEMAFFVELARLGNLSATARALDLTPPAVTKRLAMMEQRLGVRLVNRTTRRVSLTSEGETYLAQAIRILEQIRDMEEQVASSRAAPKGLLQVNATLGFGRTVIAPLVSRFAKRFPEVGVQLRLTDRPIDLVEEAFDIGIRFGELPDTRLTARRILSNQRFLCAAPSYLRKHGIPCTPDELGRHLCILHRQNNETSGAWKMTRGRKAETVKVQGGLSSNDGDVVLGWALDGHGILMRSEWDAAKYLESGRLQRVLAEWTLPPADLFAYYPSRQNMAAKVRVFLDFVSGQMAGERP
jgi:LysR family transcriptional activator of dmlA